uniref:Cystatin domain-containing protein n=1 Tax=Kalanchoe fedtschenkoi TaxID=63787 RepID=A0A7N0UJ67_KALFE
MDFPKSTLLLVLLLVWAAPSLSSNEEDQAEAPDSDTRFGRYVPIENISDPHITAIAKFAVEEQGKKIGVGRQFVLTKVVSGEQQIVDGTNYHLVLLAALGNGFPKKYQTFVYESRQGEKELDSFDPILYP